MNTLERVIATSPDTPTLYPQHLPERIRIKNARTKLRQHPSFREEDSKPAAFPQELLSLKETREAALAHIERQYLQDLMHSTGWDIRNACRIAGLRRARLYELLKKYDISR